MVTGADSPVAIELVPWVHAPFLNGLSKPARLLTAQRRQVAYRASVGRVNLIPVNVRLQLGREAKARMLRIGRERGRNEVRAILAGDEFHAAALRPPLAYRPSGNSWTRGMPVTADKYEAIL